MGCERVCLGCELPSVPIGPVPCPSFFLLAGVYVLHYVTSDRRANRLVSIEDVSRVFRVLQFITGEGARYAHRSFHHYYWRSVLGNYPYEDRVIR